MKGAYICPRTAQKHEQNVNAFWSELSEKSSPGMIGMLRSGSCKTAKPVLPNPGENYNWKFFRMTKPALQSSLASNAVP